jgi:Aspartyl protease
LRRVTESSLLKADSQLHFITYYSHFKKNIMRYFIFLLIILSLPCKAQKFNLNQGGTLQKGYFSVIKFENYYGYIIVTAKIEGGNYRFILDTGAPNSISKALQEKLKLKTMRKILVGDANNDKDSLSVVRMEALTFGDVTFKNVPTLVIDLPPFMVCMGVDGFIGSNMLRNSVVRFSYVDSTVTITDEVKKLNLSKAKASKIYLTHFQSNPYIYVRLMNKINEQLLFDTGDRGFYDLSANVYKKLEKHAIFKKSATGFGRASLGLYGSGKDTIRYRLQLDEMKINNANFKNITTDLSTDDNSRIGHAILKYGNATVDYKNKKFYFEPFKDTNDMSEKNFPISPLPMLNKLYVGIIWDENLKKQVSIGDQIIAIDDIDYEKMDICEVLKGSLLKGKNTVKITTKDKIGNVKSFQIERK